MHNAKRFFRRWHFSIALAIACFCWLDNSAAQTEIHKCTDADGVVSYTQLPCEAQEPAKPAHPDPDVVNDSASPEFADPLPAVPLPQDESAESATSRAACKQQYRDAIDAIDAEIASDYSPDEADDYKQRLLELTRKLRQC